MPRYLRAMKAFSTRGIAAHYYLTKDFKRGLAFYRDVVGLPIAAKSGRHAEFELPDGSTFGLSFMPDLWYPGGGVMFEVDDIGAAIDRLKAAQVRFFTDGALETEECRVAWCEDTEGNNFAVHARK
ncbi:MAG: hypothetical protein JOZ80_00530 [Acidobacteriaceae bacterium]|nr:hypothetical protein [Acidobacteriaceae bacterium]